MLISTGEDRGRRAMRLSRLAIIGSILLTVSAVAWANGVVPVPPFLPNFVPAVSPALVSGDLECSPIQGMFSLQLGVGVVLGVPGTKAALTFGEFSTTCAAAAAAVSAKLPPPVCTTATPSVASDVVLTWVCEGGSGQVLA